MIDALAWLGRIELAILIPVMMASTWGAYRREGAWSRREASALCLLVVAELALMWAVVPFAAWRANRHGYGDIPARLLHDTPIYAHELIHGSANTVAGGWSALFSLGLGNTFWFHAIWSACCLPVMAIWWAKLSGSRMQGLAAASLLAILPPWVRLGPTDVSYVLTTWMMLFLLYELEHFIQDGTNQALRRLVCWAVIVAQCRLDMMVVVPAALVGTLLVRAPERLRALASQQTHRTTLALGALAMAPRITLLAAGHVTGGEAAWMFQISNSGGSSSIIDALGRLATPLCLYGLAIWVSRRLETRRPIASMVCVTMVVGLVFAPGIAPDAWTGIEPMSLEAFASWGRIHTLLDPLYVPMGWILLAAWGLTAAWSHQRGLVLQLMIWLLPQLIAYGTQYDAPSTHTRTSLPAAPWMVGLAMSGAWHVCAGVAASHRRVVTVLLGLGIVAPFFRYIGWMSWVYPMQQESQLLMQLGEFIDTEDRVFMIRPQDYPEEQRRQGLVLSDGAEPAELVHALGLSGREPPQGLRTLLDQPDILEEPGTAYFIRTLGCNTARLGNKLDPISGEHVTAVTLRDDTFLLARDSVLFRARGLSSYDRKEFFPSARSCFAGTSERTCIDPQADGGCHLFRCRLTSETAEPEWTWTDPLCAAVEESFVLEPVLEVPLHRGNAGGAALEPVGDQGLIGVYRIVSRRQDAPSATPTEHEGAAGTGNIGL